MDMSEAAPMWAVLHRSSVWQRRGCSLQSRLVQRLAGSRETAAIVVGFVLLFSPAWQRLPPL